MKIIIAPKALFRRWVPIQSLRFWHVRGMTLLCLFTGLYAFVSPPEPYCFSTGSSWEARARHFELLYVRVLPREVLENLGNILWKHRIWSRFPPLADFKTLYLSEFWELWAQISQDNQPGVEVSFFGSFEPTCLFQISYCLRRPHALQSWP